MAGLRPGALAGLVAGAAPLHEGLGAGVSSGDGTAFAAAADVGVHHAAAALPQQLLHQLLALVPHAHVPPTVAGTELLQLSLKRMPIPALSASQCAFGQCAGPRHIGLL